MKLFIAVFTAWLSGWGCAALMDACWGFREWDAQSIALVTAIWLLFGVVSIAVVLL